MSTVQSGLFIMAPVLGPAAERIRELSHRFDPKMARGKPPHITLAGSSGVGPLPPFVSVAELRAKLEPIVATTGALSLELLPPMRFMQTEIIVLPLHPHGVLRQLHDGIATSGLPFTRARYTFAPHVTLNLYRTLEPDEQRELLSTRILEPVIIDRLEVYHTRQPQPSRKLLELPLRGASAAA